jgi:sarcosine oxidase gamma subunit
MHDRARFWASVPDWSQVHIDGPGSHVTVVTEIRQVLLVSGEVSAFLSRRGLTGAHGPRGSAEPATYALRLAPDRVLYVSDRQETVDLGWSEAGYAEADMTDGIIVVDVAGPAGLQLMQQGTSYDLLATDVRPAESANILFGGLRVAVVRRPDGWRLHVERPYAMALWTWFAQTMMSAEI